MSHTHLLSMKQFWMEQASWSQSTFGTDIERGPIGAIKHLQKEVQEAREAHEANDWDAMANELVDCQFLVFDAARRAGMTFEAFLKRCFDKLEINKQRKWQKPTSDEPVEHVR